MPIQLNTAARNILRDAYRTTLFPAGAVLTIRTGSPAGANNAATGTVLATITLPATPWTDGVGQVSKSAGAWEDTSADATGVAAYYRLTQGSYVEEGTITATGGGGDMTLDNTSLATGQLFTITSFTRTMPAA